MAVRDVAAPVPSKRMLVLKPTVKMAVKIGARGGAAKQGAAMSKIAIMKIISDLPGFILKLALEARPGASPYRNSSRIPGNRKIAARMYPAQ
jgi:hypothetical protein